MGEERVGIVGAGTMGAGIAQVALEGGDAVALYDPLDGALARARQRIADGLGRRAAKLGLAAGEAAAWVEERLGRLATTDDVAALAGGATLVIEAAVEDLALKASLFAELDAAADPDAILATNTSALSVGSIAADTARPERVVGLHFFNPAPLMPLVEVVVAPRTAPRVADRARSAVERWGKTAIRCADSPGFVVNRVNRPFTLEALRMLEAGEADVPAIDAALRAAGFPQGPFEHIDLVGLDVNLASSTAIHAALGRPDRLAPSALQARLVAAGRLGRKSGAGFYEYDEAGRAVRPAPGFGHGTGRRAAHPASALADRIRLALANEAYFALGEGVATADEIDLGLRLGAAHPSGPVAWAREIGVVRVRDELRELSRSVGGRFGPAPALEEAAAVG